MEVLKKLFAKHDADKSGSLDIVSSDHNPPPFFRSLAYPFFRSLLTLPPPQDEFYGLFNTKKSPFGDALFKLVELDGDNEFLSFSEFVQVVSTFCLFGPEEILRFAFNVVDEDHSGFVSLQELDNLAAWLHEGGPANLNTAIARIKDKHDQGDGQFSFQTFKAVHREFPFLLHPAFALQENMMSVVMGKRWWARKQRELGMVTDGAANAKPPGEQAPTLLQTIFPSIFPFKPPPPLKGEGADNDDDVDAGKSKFGREAALPPPGPEFLAYADFQAEVLLVDAHMERERKARRRKAAADKAAAVAKELVRKKDRTAKRRARMLTAELMDPLGEPLLLVHQPASVVRLFGK